MESNNRQVSIIVSKYYVALSLIFYFIGDKVKAGENAVHSVLAYFKRIINFGSLNSLLIDFSDGDKNHSAGDQFFRAKWMKLHL